MNTPDYCQVYWDGCNTCIKVAEDDWSCGTDWCQGGEPDKHCMLYDLPFVP